MVNTGYLAGSYETPELEIIEVEIEQGFAQSFIIDDLTEDGAGEYWF